MRKRQIFIFFLLILLLSNLGAPAMAQPQHSAPQHTAHAVVLADLNTGDILYSRNMHEQIHPASTTKIMTALLAIEALERGEVNIHDTVTTSFSALADQVPAGSSLDLQPGEEMNFESLLLATMLISANDASNVIAEHLSGSIENFVDLMNRRARELGAQNTNFQNAHGLTQEGHYTTAYDIFRISYFAVQNERFADLYSSAQRAHPATNMRPAGILTTTNHMTNPESPYYRSDVFGVKTGFTTPAGFALVSTATRGDVSLLAVVMGVPADGPGNHFTETAAIYDWAFESLAYQSVLTGTETITHVPITLGEGADRVALRPIRPVDALLYIGANPENIRQEIIIYSQEEDNAIMAPVNQGDVLGAIILHYGDRSFGPIPLVAASNVNLSRTAYMRSQLNETFSSLWVRLVIGVLLLLFLLYITYAILHSVRKRKRRKARMRRG